jgi:TolB-like protein
MSFFSELKRRNVFKVTAAYIVVSWLLLQISDTLVPALRLPEWFHSGVAFLLIIGFPIALVLAWAFEMTPDGLKKEKDNNGSQPRASTSGRMLNYTIIGSLAVALVYFVWESRIQTGSDPVSQEPIAQAVEPDSENRALPPVSAKESRDSNSIAVLPFINMSSDPEQEYFSDGITEEVLNLLVKIPELKVTSRTSVFAFKGQSVDIPTVAEKLGVAHILEGSVRKAGNRVRITAQLIEARNDVHLWSETYERTLDDIFAIQDEIAREVVKALHIQLLGEAPLATSTNTEAYNLYLRGKHFDTVRTLKGLESAVKAYQESIALDADFAPAWVGFSNVLREQAKYDVTDLHEGMEASRHAAMRALELDSTLAEAWLSLAEIQFYYDWDWSRAEATTRTALKYGPKNAPVLRLGTWVALVLGDRERALGLAQLAVDLDPLDYSGLTNLAFAHWGLGQLEEEEQIYRRVLELYPDRGLSSIKSFLASTLSRQGKPEESLQYLDLDSENIWQKTISALVLHSLGRHEEERSIRQNIIDEYSQTWPYGIAMIYASHGNLDKAFEWLDIAFEQKESHMTQLIINSWLTPLHDDPRWEKILDRMGLLEYWRKSQAWQEAKP